MSSLSEKNLLCDHIKEECNLQWNQDFHLWKVVFSCLPLWIYVLVSLRYKGVATLFSERKTSGIAIYEVRKLSRTKFSQYESYE